jgi:hypothetical protein
MDKTWMQESNRFGNRYIEGVNEFISMARSHVDGLDRIKCPCHSCLNRYYKPIDKVRDDLFLKGIYLNYTQWIFHGEEDPFLQNVHVEHDDENDYIYIWEILHYIYIWENDLIKAHNIYYDLIKAHNIYYVV